MAAVYAVLDTNIFVSALLNPKGTPGKIYRALRSGLCTIILTQALRKELQEVLEYPDFHLPAEAVEECLSLLDQGAKWVEPTTPVRICRDPEDNMVLEAALAAFPDVLVVSGDKDLLTLRSFHDIPILSPREFVEVLHV
jgi:putative PIN family toxin of toxin-antitoxin system